MFFFNEDNIPLSALTPFRRILFVAWIPDYPEYMPPLSPGVFVYDNYCIGM